MEIMQTSIGNHEDTAGNVAHYTERFRHMPTNSGTVATNNTPSVAPNNWCAVVEVALVLVLLALPYFAL
jgi:hypothetical protein